MADISIQHEVQEALCKHNVCLLVTVTNCLRTPYARHKRLNTSTKWQEFVELHYCHNIEISAYFHCSSKGSRSSIHVDVGATIACAPESNVISSFCSTFASVFIL